MFVQYYDKLFYDMIMKRRYQNAIKGKFNLINANSQMKKKV